jgi:hypothetical protein
LNFQISDPHFIFRTRPKFSETALVHVLPLALYIRLLSMKMNKKREEKIELISWFILLRLSPIRIVKRVGKLKMTT